MSPVRPVFCRPRLCCLYSAAPDTADPYPDFFAVFVLWALIFTENAAKIPGQTGGRKLKSVRSMTLKELLKIGLVIADDMEYADLETLMGNRLEPENFFTRRGHRFCLRRENRCIEIHAILCGIGTVNAAAAAMHLVDSGVDILLNYGLSGGISGVCRGEDVVGLSYMEYDFDLTSCGYQKCEKPAQTYIYKADSRLVDLLLNTGSAKKTGNMASGDRFVSDPALRDTLRDAFSVHCCDMETSSIAYVAELAGLPFAALRRVSDDAGEDATADYREMNLSSQSSLPQELLLAVEALFDADDFWQCGERPITGLGRPE